MSFWMIFLTVLSFAGSMFMLFAAIGAVKKNSPTWFLVCFLVTCAMFSLGLDLVGV